MGHRLSYDVILDQTLTTGQDGKAIELSLEEALEQQLLKEALAGKPMATRKVLQMIEEREEAFNKGKAESNIDVTHELHYSPDNANEALRILGIAEPDMRVGGVRWNIHTWATQAALSRPGRKKFTPRQKKDIDFFTFHPEELRWPKGRIDDE